MSDDTNDVPTDETNTVPVERELWTTPRVLASEPFGVAQGNPDGSPVEGTPIPPYLDGYGPS